MANLAKVKETLTKHQLMEDFWLYFVVRGLASKILNFSKESITPEFLRNYSEKAICTKCCAIHFECFFFNGALLQFIYVSKRNMVIFGSLGGACVKSLNCLSDSKYRETPLL